MSVVIVWLKYTEHECFIREGKMRFSAEEQRVVFERNQDKLIGRVSGTELDIITQLFMLTEGDDKGKYHWHINGFSINGNTVPSYYPANNIALELADIEESVKRFITRYVRD